MAVIYVRFFGVGLVDALSPFPDVARFTFSRGPRGGLYVTGLVAATKADVYAHPLVSSPTIDDGWIEVKTDADLRRVENKITAEYPDVWKEIRPAAMRAPVPALALSAPPKKAKPKTSSKKHRRKD